MYAIIFSRYGGVAQLGERTVRIRKVKGSNPSVSTTIGDQKRYVAKKPRNLKDSWVISCLFQ